jgi:spore maturation protein CgeB
MFEPGKEVLAYKSDEECLDLIDRALKQPAWGSEIAQAGHARTLKEHTYEARVGEVLRLLEDVFRKQGDQALHRGEAIDTVGRRGGSL